MVTGLSCCSKLWPAGWRDSSSSAGRSVEILDKDDVRNNLTNGLGFSRENCDENIRRTAFVCGLLSKHGAVAISAVISFYRGACDKVRSKIANFVKV